MNIEYMIFREGDYSFQFNPLDGKFELLKWNKYGEIDDVYNSSIDARAIDNERLNLAYEFMRNNMHKARDWYCTDYEIRKKTDVLKFMTRDKNGRSVFAKNWNGSKE